MQDATSSTAKILPQNLDKDFGEDEESCQSLLRADEREEEEKKQPYRIVVLVTYVFFNPHSYYVVASISSYSHTSSQAHTSYYAH